MPTVLVLVYPSVNTLDINGPVGSYSRAATPRSSPPMTNSPPPRKTVDYCVCKLGPKSPGPLGERVLFSVCSGSYLLAAAGVLDGLTATSHRLGLGALRQLGDEYKSRTPGAKGMEVVPENVTGTVHYVDAGMNASQVRIVTSGSITNGIDAALYLISLRSGRPDAVEVASFMGYTWREM
ncbi:hypothetical protein KXW98_003026 [Aspergillus fumigatus]|uniref:DJ-1/PfpI domain-containing protein n=1 Tax=Aspergillus fumigatus TaxID=746128 RepID=A0A8H4HI03_ASPFM|nr:hypothetical protein CNMCM8057_005790 [Aspergillus fumigatus]KMK55010.1 hypothetical protein Y699_09356 [Aspergillus fumigatus Z5]KAF4257054.1 hypothetical protein CNMCM8714_003135 [Aspergillus fumigatus]KAF4265190.1 hypothetical protein CNMCM8812_003247 [Aspergillus fumigatus]KAF4284353.1 hypothetical protein CNMCM8689_006200 [Aspergillus fumigatus]